MTDKKRKIQQKLKGYLLKAMMDAKSEIESIVQTNIEKNKTHNVEEFISVDADKKADAISKVLKEEVIDYIDQVNNKVNKILQSPLVRATVGLQGVSGAPGLQGPPGPQGPQGPPGPGDPTATRLIHEPIITPSRSSSIQVQETTPRIVGETIPALEFASGQTALRMFKIPRNYVGEPSIHIHWTKNSNTNQSGNTVTWRVRYKVFDGSSDEVTTITTETITHTATYNDTGTTTRIICRTPDLPLNNFVAGYYVGMIVDWTAKTMSDDPLLISLDLVYRATINEGDESDPDISVHFE